MRRWIRADVPEAAKHGVASASGLQSATAIAKNNYRACLGDSVRDDGHKRTRVRVALLLWIVEGPRKKSLETSNI